MTKSVTGVTRQKVEEIDDASIVSAELVNNSLRLRNRGAAPIDIGNVQGPPGSGGFQPKFSSMISSFVGSIGNAAFTAIGGWSHISGSDATFMTYDSAVNDFNFSPVVNGVYIVNFTFSFNTHATGRRIPAIFKNGVEVRRLDVSAVTGLFEIGITNYMILNTTDILTLRVYQNSGAAMTPFIAANVKHKLQIIRAKTL